LLKHSPFALALQKLPTEIGDAIVSLLNVTNSQELVELVKQQPLLLTEEVMAAIEMVIQELQQTQQERTAESLQALYEVLKLLAEPEESTEELPAELVHLFQEWIGTQTWSESYEMLKANAESLLSDEALTTLNSLLLLNNENEGLTRTLEQHRTIVEKARGGSIDDAYTALSYRYKLANILINASNPIEFRQTVPQYPDLLQEEMLQDLALFADEIEGKGQKAAAKALRLRLHEMERLHKLQQPVRQPSRELSLLEEDGQVSIKADRGGAAFNKNAGIVNIFNMEHYEPQKQWQEPVVQGFKERKAFVGRQQDLEKLLQYLTEGESVAITGSIALQGMGGIGKTYLAQKLIVELQDRFPGCIIWITLGPHVRDLLSAQNTLGELAKYVFGGLLPITTAGQLQPEIVASWLDEMAPPGQLLVVLDDIWHLGALKIMERALPPRALRLITTRNADVAEVSGGKTLSLEKLSPQDGLDLLLNRLGNLDDPSYLAALEQLVTVLEGHALALDIAASIIKKPARVQTILNMLQQEIGRGALATLKLGEGEERETNLEKSLALSYDMMSNEQKSFFRVLGVFEAGTVITPELAGALWNLEDLEAVKKALFELEDLALLTQIASTNVFGYQQHGLLRAYARALLDKTDELISICWTHAYCYTELVEGTEVADYSLLDEHIPNILIALQWTTNNEPLLQARLLSASFQFLLIRGYSLLLESYLPGAVEASANNRINQANFLTKLGDLESGLGNVDQARAHYDAALPLFRLERHRLGEANLLKSLGDFERHLGNLDQARIHYDAALPLFQRERSRLGEANLLMSLGDLEGRLGNLDQARIHYDAALPLFQRERHRLGEANVYRSIAFMFVEQQNWLQAQNYCEQALPLYIAERDPLGEANTLCYLGRARFELGNYLQGINDMQKAAELFKRIQVQEWAEYAEKDLGEMQLRLELSTDGSEGMVALSAETWQSLQILLALWYADWDRRRQILEEYQDLLLSEDSEQLFGLLAKILEKTYSTADASHIVKRLRTKLGYCRTWDPEAGWFFITRMRMGDNIDIPDQYEDTVKQIVTLLSQQQEETFVQSIEIMQTLLDHLTTDTSALFEAALLCDLATALTALPDNHPARSMVQIATYYREALPIYQEAPGHSSTVTFIQEALANYG
jgi:tetratricopeptide (TPR) repeat protein